MDKQRDVLTDSPIKVKLPELRLKIADLAYLRALANPNPNGTPTCHDSNAKDRLLFLGLIEKKQVSPTPVVQREVAKKLREIRTEVFAMCRKGDWDRVQNLSYDAKRAIGLLAPTTKMLPTKAGLQLLKQGETLSNIKGCAPRGIR